MPRYQRLGFNESSPQKPSSPGGAMNGTNYLNSTTDDDEEDDNESLVSSMWNGNYHNKTPSSSPAPTSPTSSNPKTARTTTTTASSSEALSLFEELNSCHVNLVQVDLDEEGTMELPLLREDKVNNNCDNDFPAFPFKAKQCHCEQPGFGANLVSKSTKDARFKILLAISLCCIFMLIEFIGGYMAGSLAIMTDAAHLASDCISFIIGLVAIWLGSKPPDAKMSFGYKRMEVLGAIISIVGIWILTATLVIVAIQRVITNDYDLDANAMMVISGIGIGINIVMIFVLHGADLPEFASHAHSHGHGSCHGHSHSHGHSHGHSHEHGDYLHNPTDDYNKAFVDNAGVESKGEPSMRTPLTMRRNSNRGPNGDVKVCSSEEHSARSDEQNLNLRAAMIHVIGDLVQSVGVFLASVFIKFFPHAQVADPLCTLLFSVIVIMTTIHLFKESIGILLDSVPKGINLNDLELDLIHLNGVRSVHHLNVWNHTSNHTVLMVHLVIDFLADSNIVLEKATQLATGKKYKIQHCTIQIERLAP